MELYPWHSRGWDRKRVVRGGVETLADLAREFIFEPIAEVKVDYAFSFTNQWLDIAENLQSRGLLRRLHCERLEAAQTSEQTPAPVPLRTGSRLEDETRGAAPAPDSVQIMIDNPDEPTSAGSRRSSRERTAQHLGRPVVLYVCRQERLRTRQDRGPRNHAYRLRLRTGWWTATGRHHKPQTRRAARW